jgi:GxxExxY protein
MLQHAEITGEAIAAAIEVHRVLGPGLLEPAYESCLCRELELRGLRVAQQAVLPVHCKDVALDCGFRLDAVVNDSVILELTCVSEITDLHKA